MIDKRGRLDVEMTAGYDVVVLIAWVLVVAGVVAAVGVVAQGEKLIVSAAAIGVGVAIAVALLAVAQSIVVLAKVIGSRKP